MDPFGRSVASAEAMSEESLTPTARSARSSGSEALQLRWLSVQRGAAASKLPSSETSTSARTWPAASVMTEPLSSIGRACLPGYGTSRKAVEAGHKLKRGPSSPEEPESGAEELTSRAGDFSWRMEQQRLRSADGAARVSHLAQQRQKEKQQQRDAAKAQADATWFGRAPRLPLGVAKAQWPEFHDLNDQELKLKVAQRMVFPDTQAQEQCAGTLLVGGAAGATRSFYPSGRLSLRGKPRRDVSGFADVFRHGVGTHPYQIYGTLPFSAGEWKY